MVTGPRSGVGAKATGAAQHIGVADQTADEMLRVGVVLGGTAEGAPQGGFPIDVSQGQDSDGNRSSAARGRLVPLRQQLARGDPLLQLPDASVQHRRVSVCCGPMMATH